MAGGRFADNPYNNGRLPFLVHGQFGIGFDDVMVVGMNHLVIAGYEIDGLAWGGISKEYTLDTLDIHYKCSAKEKDGKNYLAVKF